MNLGREIVAEALRSGNLKPYLDAGMTASWVKSDDAAVAVFDGVDQAAWLWLLDHHRKHGTVAPDLFARAYTPANYRLPHSSFKPAELIEEAQREVATIMVGELADDLVDYCDDGRAVDAGDRIHQTLQRLQQGIRDTAETATSIADFDLEEALETELEMGVPLGIDLIDNVFFGLQPTMLATLLGRQKATKSTLMLNSALTAWDHGYDVLFYSVELDITFLRQRLYSLGAHVSPERFRRGTLRGSEKGRVRDFHDRISGDSVNFRVSHKKAMVTMDDLAAEVARYKPHVVYVDGFYFMQDRATRKSAGSDWQANENVAAELKNLAMEQGIVIITSTQAQEKQQGSRKGAGIEGRTIMGGTGLLKASDLVLGADKDGDGGTIVNEVLNRFIPVPTVRITWDWNEMIMDVSPYEDPEEARARQAEAYADRMGDE